MFHFIHNFQFRTALFIGIFLLVLTGCVPMQPVVQMSTVAPTPAVSEPVVSVPQPVNPGEQIGISIRVDSVAGVEIAYEWSVLEGQGEILAGQGTNAITYEPPVEPGTYGIRVRVTTEDAVIERSSFVTVRDAHTSESLTSDSSPDTPTTTEIVSGESSEMPSVQPAPSVTSVSAAAIRTQKTRTELTGESMRGSYNEKLNEGEIIVGHAYAFEGTVGCVAFLISGPGDFTFWLESGLWDRWVNTTPELNETLLDEQRDVMLNKYKCASVSIRRLP